MLELLKEKGREGYYDPNSYVFTYSRSSLRSSGDSKDVDLTAISENEKLN
jgi:hypothetical protein